MIDIKIELSERIQFLSPFENMYYALTKGTSNELINFFNVRFLRLISNRKTHSPKKHLIFMCNITN